MHPITLITLSALFLFASTTLAAPLGLSSRHRQDDNYSSLASRSNVATGSTGADIGNTVQSDFDDQGWQVVQHRRKKGIVEKPPANAAVVGQPIVNQATPNERTGDGHRKTSDIPKIANNPTHKHAAEAQTSQNSNLGSVLAEPTDSDMRLRNIAAGNEHRKTSGLPHRNQTFLVRGGNGIPDRTYTGKDVREANFANYHGRQSTKIFHNLDHVNPGSRTTKPIPGMVGKGIEHVLSGATSDTQKDRQQNHGSKLPKIVSQTDDDGNHQHMGVIAHKFSKKRELGKQDHFLIDPKDPESMERILSDTKYLRH